MGHPKFKIFFPVLILMICGASVLEANGQVSQKRLEELKSKYDWGSIYLSYGIMPDIIQVVSNQIRLASIKKRCRCSPPQSLVSFLGNYREPAQRRSIAVFQINFSASTPVAGYLTSYDLNGTINRVPITPEEVVAAADWVDLYLTNGKEWSRVMKMLEGPATALADAWHALGNLNENPFISESRITSLLMHFRIMQIDNPIDLEKLATNDRALYETLRVFAMQFDLTTMDLAQKFKERAFLWEDEKLRADKGLYKRQGLKGTVKLDWESYPLDDALESKIYNDYQQLLRREKQKSDQPRK